MTLYRQFRAPDDGRRNRLKQVEQLIEINRSRKRCIFLVVVQRYTRYARIYERPTFHLFSFSSLPSFLFCYPCMSLHLIVILSMLMLIGGALAVLNETFWWFFSLSPAENFRKIPGLERSVMLPKKKNSVALVRERTIPTERPPPVGEVSANICG